ncbi:SOS response-associated peptidase [Jeongeupia sp. USM3]|uniref:SOS response-associated peptidase n=1 Tax=Jeongeupia sp. USM3 TaxID=1906741 RepID=UPI00089DEDEF|nr:SOS response-associated peptidase family protein [Jeongeupia sp. USM3]AOX99453.1 hypothetical protein BJP62_02660 [Jeongeupia sp. USM3]
MCVNYTPVPSTAWPSRFGTPAPLGDWPDEAWQDYAAPIIVAGDGGREAMIASYGMIPKRKLPPGRKPFSTMNARAETVGELPSYRTAWRRHYRCLVPMHCFYEPCYETGQAERWRIEPADGEAFAVAGIWRPWKEDDGGYSFSFSQLTVNADAHPLMSRMHRPGDEKRSLVVIAERDYDAWLDCASVLTAEAFLRLPGNLYGAPVPRATPTTATLF